MKNRIGIFIITLTLVVASVPVADALSKEPYKEISYKINSLDNLKNEMRTAYSDKVMTKSEAIRIADQTEPGVLVEFITEKMDDANRVIEAENVDIDKILAEGKNGKGSVILDIGDNCEVIVEFEDRKEPSLVDKFVSAICQPCYAATNGETMWKPYGNRYFTAKKTVLSGIGGAVIKLENHYKVSKNGLDERYGDAYVNFSFSAGITGNITAGTPVISDSKARTPGKSNINMYARFPYYFDGQGVIASSGTYKLRTAVDYLEKNAKKKQIKVKHRWSL